MADSNPILQSMLNKHLTDLANPQDQEQTDPNDLASQLHAIYPANGNVPLTGAAAIPGERPPWAGTPYAPAPGRSMSPEDAAKVDQLSNIARQAKGENLPEVPSQFSAPAPGGIMSGIGQEQAPETAQAQTPHQQVAQALVNDEMAVQQKQQEAEKKIEQGTVNTFPLNTSDLYQSAASAFNKITDSPRTSSALNKLSSLVDQRAKLLNEYMAKVKVDELGRPDYAKTLHEDGMEGYLKQNRILHEKNQQELDDITEQIKNRKLDPSSYWQNKGIMSQMLAGISIALGAYGQTLAGGSTNVAMEIINKAVDRDWEAQKGELDKLFKLHDLTAEKGKQLNEQETHDLTVLNNSELIEQAHRQAKFAVIEGQLKINEDQTNNEAQKLKYEQLRGQLKEQQSKLAVEEFSTLDKIFATQINLAKAIAAKNAKGQGKAPTAGMLDKINTGQTFIQGLNKLKEIPPEKLKAFLAWGQPIFERLPVTQSFAPYFDSAEKAGFRTELSAISNLYRQISTGTQAGWKELEYLKSILPSLGDRNPEIFNKKLNESINQFTSTYNNYLTNMSTTGYNIGDLQAVKSTVSGLEDQFVALAKSKGYTEQAAREHFRARQQQQPAVSR